MGAMTGRAAGYCSGSGLPGYANAGFGRGFRMGYGRGRGFGGGRGRRYMFHASGLPGRQRLGDFGFPYGYPAPVQKPDPDWEKQSLRSQAEMLQSELDAVKKRLAEFEAQSDAD